MTKTGKDAADPFSDLLSRLARVPKTEIDAEEKREHRNKERLKAAIEQVRADLADLETQIPIWNSDNISGTRLYRPIADRIVAAATRLKALVAENTDSSR